MSSWDGNIAGITKGTFEVKTDSNSGIKFVTKTKDELTKIIEVTTKRKHPVLCLKTQGQDIAVLSFEKYISKLHPSCDKLWQRPHDDFDESDATWCCNVSLGEKNTW